MILWFFTRTHLAGELSSWKQQKQSCNLLAGSTEATLCLCGHQHCGLSNAGVGLGQQLFVATNLRQPRMKSDPLTGYKRKKKKVACAINVFHVPWSNCLV